jgi:hypothetical protein
MKTTEPHELKEAQPGEKTVDENDRKRVKSPKKPWSKPRITDMGKISEKDFIKVFKPKI